MDGMLMRLSPIITVLMTIVSIQKIYSAIPVRSSSQPYQQKGISYFQPLPITPTIPPALPPQPLITPAAEIKEPTEEDKKKRDFLLLLDSIPWFAGGPTIEWHDRIAAVASRLIANGVMTTEQAIEDIKNAINKQVKAKDTKWFYTETDNPFEKKSYGNPQSIDMAINAIQTLIQKSREKKIAENVEKAVQLQEKKEKTERLEKEKLEQERLEKEKLEKEKIEQEKRETERLEQEKLEQQRLEKVEQTRLANERLEQWKLEKVEQMRLASERLEQERLEEERHAAERRLEQERIEKERLKTEKLEQARIEAERVETERVERERLQREREQRKELYGTHDYELLQTFDDINLRAIFAKIHTEELKSAKENQSLSPKTMKKINKAMVQLMASVEDNKDLLKQEALNNVKYYLKSYGENEDPAIIYSNEDLNKIIEALLIQQETADREKLEQERIERERLEQERLETERLEQERLERERIEKERLEAEKQQEQEKLEREKLERERLERLEQEKLAQREKERLATEKVKTKVRKIKEIKAEEEKTKIETVEREKIEEPTVTTEPPQITTETAKPVEKTKTYTSFKTALDKVIPKAVDREYIDYMKNYNILQPGPFYTYIEKSINKKLAATAENKEAVKSDMLNAVKDALKQRGENFDVKFTNEELDKIVEPFFL
jgi:hypothetical protein